MDIQIQAQIAQCDERIEKLYDRYCKENPGNHLTPDEIEEVRLDRLAEKHGQG